MYLDGTFVPSSAAKISIYNFGIVIGATITDLLRTFHGKPYKLREHIHRFFQSCKYASIVPPLSPPDLVSITEEVLARNLELEPEGRELAVVWFITPGENPLYAGSAAGAAALRPTFCAHTFPLRFGIFRPFFTDGVQLAIPSIRHIPSECVDAKVKHRSRLHWWLAEREVKQRNSGTVPLLLDRQGNLTETSGANFLLVRDGEIFSPTSRNILCGISRSVVRELCSRLQIRFHEKDLQTHDAVTADEAFLVTTPYCIAPVASINGIPIGGGPTNRPIYERLLAAWSADVGLDIRQQILNCVD